MNSIKCSKCGLINFATTTVCKKCGGILDFFKSQDTKFEKLRQKMQTDIEITRSKEIVIGVLLIVGGVVAFLANWSNAIIQGKFRHGMSIMAPVILFSGIMLIAFPYPDKSKFPKSEFAPKS